ncbi:MAG TPA: DUF3298 and DUF4163 domain-containing protein [Patescibacteria group bacterium]|nr:DUF3298 and DUF4163 domain-containing protein [Patescibacteria group bacterium]
MKSYRWVWRYFALLACFALALPVANAAPAAPVRVSQQVIQDERFTVWLPQLEGLADPVVQDRLNEKISQDMKQEETAFQRAWEQMQQTPQIPDSIKKSAHFWGTYAVKLNKDGLLSLTVSQYYIAGGAHGSTMTRSYTMEVVTGKLLALQDIFRPDAAYRERLNEWIREDIRRKGKTMYRFEGIREQQSFYLTEEGLVLFYQPYEIASWADGYIRFVIPYDQIRDLLRQDLPLY